MFNLEEATRTYTLSLEDAAKLFAAKLDVPVAAVKVQYVTSTFYPDATSEGWEQISSIKITVDQKLVDKMLEDAAR